MTETQIKVSPNHWELYKVKYNADRRALDFKMCCHSNIGMVVGRSPAVSGEVNLTRVFLGSS